jgi:hypothetical protein
VIAKEYNMSRVEFEDEMDFTFNNDEIKSEDTYDESDDDDYEDDDVMDENFMIENIDDCNFANNPLYDDYDEEDADFVEDEFDIDFM